MGVKIGFEGKLFRNTGTSESPTWSEIDNVMDLAVNHEKGEADVTTRGNAGYEAIKGAIKKAPLEITQVQDREDEDWEAFRDSYFNGTSVHLAIADGAIETDGTEYFSAEYEVLKWTDDQPLNDKMGTSITAKPTYSTEVTPGWTEVTGV